MVDMTMGLAPFPWADGDFGGETQTFLTSVFNAMCFTVATLLGSTNYMQMVNKV